MTPQTFSPNAPLAYRIRDACQVIGLGTTSIYKLAGEGKLRLVKVAGRTLVDAASLRSLIGAGS